MTQTPTDPIAAAAMTPKGTHYFGVSPETGKPVYLHPLFGKLEQKHEDGTREWVNNGVTIIERSNGVISWTFSENTSLTPAERKKFDGLLKAEAMRREPAPEPVRTGTYKTLGDLSPAELEAFRKDLTAAEGMPFYLQAAFQEREDNLTRLAFPDREFPLGKKDPTYLALKEEYKDFWSAHPMVTLLTLGFNLHANKRLPEVLDKAREEKIDAVFRKYGLDPLDPLPPGSRSTKKHDTTPATPKP